MKDEDSVPMWGTQGGSLAVQEKSGAYVFIEKPDCPGLGVGDRVPGEWGLIPANDAARSKDDFREFREDPEYFDSLFF